MNTDTSMEWLFDDELAKAVFLAQLPTGKNGQLIPGHTT